MSAREPQEMAQAPADTGAKKAHRTWDRVLVGAVGFVATSYWYLFLKDQPEKVTAVEEPAERA
jgi:hypothetical protein